MFYLAIIVAKLTHLIIKVFRFGSGYTWPGYVASIVYPGVLSDFNRRYKTRYILVSGTNGKTTTSKLIAHVLTKHGYKVSHNISGANLINGVISTLLLNTGLKKNSPPDYCVLEVDEAILPKILESVVPTILILLNLSRDQLDRYGEIDIILDKWVASLRNLHSTRLILDANKSNLSKIPANYKGPVFYFDSTKEAIEHTSLVGDFNALNVNAAVAALSLEGITKSDIFSHLSSFEVAYGRGEQLEFRDKFYYIFLAKNPMSFNNNLTLLSNKTISYDSLLFVLNDEVRDGRDVSWIYDINSDLLKQVCLDKNIYVSGTRSFDFSTRLMYAGVNVSNMKDNSQVSACISTISANKSPERIVVLPNYSAMLNVRKVLTGKEIL